MGHVARMEEINCIRNLSEVLNARDHLRDLGVGLGVR
jgi:hypothetical protein